MVQAVSSVRFGSPRFGAKVEIEPSVENHIFKEGCQTISDNISSFKGAFDALQFDSIEIKGADSGKWYEPISITAFNDIPGSPGGRDVIMRDTIKGFLPVHALKVLGKALEVGFLAQKELYEEKFKNAEQAERTAKAQFKKVRRWLQRISDIASQDSVE